MYAKASIRSIGYEHICLPCWSHSVQWFMLRSLPDALLNWYIFRYFLGMRKRGLKKESKNQNLEVADKSISGSVMWQLKENS